MLRPLLRNSAAAFLFALGMISGLKAQDIAVRVEAIRLVERASAASHPSRVMLDYKHEVNFRAYGLEGTSKDGQFIRILTANFKRYETIFGAYDFILVRAGDKLLESDYLPPPPETLELHRLLPVLVGRFDDSDTIHSITSGSLLGRPSKCIQFETVNGRTHQSNEICVDDELGTLIRWNVGDERIDDTDYVQFEGVWWPTHIQHYINGTLRMEIEQKFTRLEGPIDSAALTPSNPHFIHACEQSRRPIIQSAPQPPSAGAGPWYDVKIHAVIGEDGRVHNPTVLSEGRPDLEKEALRIVSQWIFSPALCNGEPNPVPADLVVHFPPQ